MKLSDINILDVGNTIQLAGAVWAGGGRAYLVMFPEDSAGLRVDQPSVDQFEVFLSNSPSAADVDPDDMRLEVLEMSVDDWQVFLRQTDVLETEILARAKDGSLVKAVARKSQRQIDQNVSWAVFRRDEYACRYCGKNNVPLTVDHLIRWEEGGPSVEENLLSACRKCNRTRGDMSYSEWLGSKAYKANAGFRSEQVEDWNWQLQFKLDAIPRRVHVHSRG